MSFGGYALIFLLLRRWSIAAYDSGAMPPEEEIPKPGSLRALLAEDEYARAIFGVYIVSIISSIFCLLCGE